jgi:hypothetical protein
MWTSEALTARVFFKTALKVSNIAIDQGVRLSFYPSYLNANFCGDIEKMLHQCNALVTGGR